MNLQSGFCVLPWSTQAPQKTSHTLKEFKGNKNNQCQSEKKGKKKIASSIFHLQPSPKMTPTRKTVCLAVIAFDLEINILGSSSERNQQTLPLLMCLFSRIHRISFFSLKQTIFHNEAPIHRTSQSICWSKSQAMHIIYSINLN